MNIFFFREDLGSSPPVTVITETPGNRQTEDVSLNEILRDENQTYFLVWNNSTYAIALAGEQDSIRWATSQTGTRDQAIAYWDGIQDKSSLFQ